MGGVFWLFIYFHHDLRYVQYVLALLLILDTCNVFVTEVHDPCSASIGYE